MQKENEVSEQMYQQLCNNTPDLMWSVNKEFTLVAANNAFIGHLKKITGKLVAPGDNLMMREIFLGKLLVWWNNLYSKALAGESFKEELYTTPVSPGEEGRWMEISFNPFYDNDCVTGITCYARNITECKRNEDILARMNKELEFKAKELARSNKELEQFAYIASHDLQEPLRSVSNFLQLLERKYKGRIDEESATYIRFAVEGASRMKWLIRDLLEYSKVGNNAEETDNTDMNEVAAEVVNLFHQKITELQASVRVSLLPVVENTSKSQLLHLLLNLVNNALKYHSDERPIVEIDAVREKRHWLFSVKDNGIGIALGFENKIFEIFQRLHHGNEYPGTGIGLAISKKIVEKHGGTIWVIAESGKGCTFYFTLPCKDPT